jgi:iron complex outermembrane receptor protein
VPRTSDPAAYNAVMGRTDNYGGTVATPAAGSGAYAPRIPRYRRSQTDYERTGITSSFQWRPSSKTDVNLDLMYGKFANKRYDNYIEAISFGRTLAQANGKPQTSILESHFDDNGSWDYGRFNGVDVRTEGLLDVYTTKFRQHVLSGSHKFSDTVKMNFLFGSSNSNLNEPMRATVQFDAPNVNDFSWDFRNNRNVPTLNYGIDITNPNAFSFAPQDPDGTVHGQFVGRYLDTTNKLNTNEINLSWELNDHLTSRFGLSRRKNTWSNLEIGSGGNGLTLPAGVTMASISRADHRLRFGPGRHRRAKLVDGGGPRQVPRRVRHRMPLLEPCRARNTTCWARPTARSRKRSTPCTAWSTSTTTCSA